MIVGFGDTKDIDTKKLFIESLKQVETLIPEFLGYIPGNIIEAV